MAKCQFLRNSQLKPKKKIYKNNNGPQRKGNQIKIIIITKNPLHKINIIELVLFVARVGILVDFANIGNANLFHKLK